MSSLHVRSPLLSARAFTLVSIPVFLAIALLVFWRSAGPFIVELQITLYIVAAVLLGFLTVALYKGVRVQRSPADRPVWRSLRHRFKRPPISAGDVADAAGTVIDVASSVDISDIDLPDLPDGGDDLVGCLFSIGLWVVVAVLIITLLPVVLEVVWAVLFLLIAVLYWIFYRALRVVFIQSRKCRGNWLRSVGYAGFYTVLYTGWLFVVVLIVKSLTM
ncbi:MAG TPA: hypothetical protein VLG46_14080, partial [Anaerolineae bacterium]|nr:hypothetical protein [Anaerolineae bacterium]